MYLILLYSKKCPLDLMNFLLNLLNNWEFVYVSLPEQKLLLVNISLYSSIQPFT